MSTNKSTLVYVLKSLVPYTDENLKLTYHPNAFFNELERMSERKMGRHISTATIRTTYYRAKNQSLIFVGDSGKPSLSHLGKRKIEVFKPNRLPKSKLLVTFDIPETERQKRRILRQTLRELKFTQVQQSVWVSNYDGREMLIKDIEYLDIKNNVNLYEAFKI